MKGCPVPVFSFMLACLFVCAPAFTANDEISTECAARCAGFTDQAYVQCVSTCVHTSKKHRKQETKSVSKRMDECEEICSVYQGVDKVKCLRLCLDKNK